MPDVRRQRRRAPRSCVECRRRKIKCNRNQPCSQCLLSKCSCLYGAEHSAPPLRPVLPGRSLPEVLPPQIFHASPTTGHVAGNGENRHASDMSRSSLVPHVSLAAVRSTGATDGYDAPPSSASIHSDKKRDDELKALTSRIRSLEELLLQYEAPTAATRPNQDCSWSRNHTADHLREEWDDVHDDAFRSQSALVLNKSRLFGQTHWTNAVHEFKKIAGFLNNETRTSVGNEALTDNVAVEESVLAVRTRLQECKMLSLGLKMIRPGKYLSRPKPIVSDRDTAYCFAQLYTSHFESVFRVLHVPSFWNEFHRYWEDPAAVSDVLTLKVQLVIAIGSGLSTDSSTADAKNVHRVGRSWVHKAQEWLSAPIEKGRLSLDCLQVQCLLMLARQVLSVGSDLCWIGMGTILRCAIQLGLHRDPNHFPSMNTLEAEVRRRLWATILELNIQTSLDSGTTPGISCSDFDTGPPANINDEDMDADTTACTLRHQPDEVVTQTSLQRFLFRNSPARLEMLHSMNGLGSPLKDEEILSFSERMSNACRQCMSHCQTQTILSSSLPTYSSAAEETEITAFTHAIAQLLLRRFLLALHRPFAGRINENAIYYHSRKLSFDTAAALLKPVTPGPNRSAMYSHLMMSSGGFFRSTLIHISLALGSELLIEIGSVEGDEEGQIRAKGAWDGGSPAYRRLLADAVRQSRDVWAERLRQGDTNVHSHMKLSIVLGLVDEVERRIEETGRGIGEINSMRQCMALSAKESLETCIALVRSYSGLSSMGSEGESRADGECGIVAEGSDQLHLANCSFDLDSIFHTSDIGAFDSHLLTL
ncbi:hypothetical protein F5Y16DRAFT_301896 [Xylariaceae sp. FL0255]|nr:hypothetical protein F5Y16DRAFT_301896 [Xylariaceae sp. FL0255]